MTDAGSLATVAEGLEYGGAAAVRKGDGAALGTDARSELTRSSEHLKASMEHTNDILHEILLIIKHVRNRVTVFGRLHAV